MTQKDQATKVILRGLHRPKSCKGLEGTGGNMRVVSLLPSKDKLKGLSAERWVCIDLVLVENVTDLHTHGVLRFGCGPGAGWY